MKQMMLVIPSFFGVSIEVYFIVVLLATPLFFVWRWLFKKFIKPGWVRNTVSALVAIISAPFVYIVATAIIIAIALYHPNDEFDKAKWFADKEKRYELSQSIIENKMLLGKTKVEVEQILGNEHYGEDNHWEYYLGFVPSIVGIDPDVLDIYFENDKIIKVEQHET